MDLNIHHRNSLLAALEAAQEDRDLQKRCIESEAIKDADGVYWFEVEHFLALERIALIKRAIASNNIDY